MPEPSALSELFIEAPDPAAAHAELGRLLGGAIRSVVERRARDAGPTALVAQLRTARAVARHLEHKRTAAVVPEAVREALSVYHACLYAWGEAAQLASAAPLAELDGAPLDALTLALWLQDDNTGCQTGVLRTEHGVLLFHTEEDTIGYFDRARLLHMTVAGVQRSAFLYPYLLPGPAFCWDADGVLAYDTLNLVRTESGGTPTSTLSFLAWWLRGELPLCELARALTPFLDGGALCSVRRAAGRVSAEQVEVGGSHVAHTRFSELPSARHVQVNMLSPAAEGALQALELYDAAGRAPYEGRLARAHAGLAALGSTPRAEAVLGLLAATEGDSWAFANDDVVAHLVAEVRPGGLTLQVGAGPSRPGAPRGRWELP
jgi:hypothetical protein